MFPENYNLDDGLFAAIKILELVSCADKPLSELVKSVKVYESSEEVSFEAKNPKTVFDRLIAEFPEAKLIEIDGVYLDFPDGFISVRQSQNELEIFRIRAEAKTKADLKFRFEKAIEIVKA
jgi:phosphomannomutase